MANMMDTENVDKIAAMAIAAIAENFDVEVHKVRIISFQEIEDDVQEDQR